ncbi:MAG: ribosome silencing factor [Nitrospinae bacterium]|nr:ribosome silencing factor [Nitrospinota bacterium]
MTLKEKASLCYNSALSKKALEVSVLDVRGLSDVADVFLIAGATSRQHAQTIVSAVEDALRDAGQKGYHVEGYQNARWALIDAGDVIVHVFTEETREYYGLDRLWGDAEPLKLNGK